VTNTYKEGESGFVRDTPPSYVDPGYAWLCVANSIEHLALSLDKVFTQIKNVSVSTGGVNITIRNGDAADTETRSGVGD